MTDEDAINGSDSARFPCPYCASKQEPTADKCHVCGRRFPWSLQLEKVYDELKEREPNRIRATATLVQEAFAAAQGGTPVSLSALKGFVTSWLLPRTVIVLGSLAGGLLLGVQTYILWNQTRLLDQQTIAAQAEQTAKLRERIAVLNTHATAIERLRQEYISELLLPDCVSTTCSSETINDTLSGLREDSPTLPAADVSALLLSLSEQLAAMSTAVDKVVLQPELHIRDEEGDNKIAVVTELLRPAVATCLLNPKKGAALVDRANAFALLSGNAFWITFPLGKPKEYLESAAEFPQIQSNTRMGLISYESSISAIRTLAATESATVITDSDRVPDDYTVESFISDVATVKRLLVSSLDELLDACRELTDRDRAVLRALQPIEG